MNRNDELYELQAELSNTPPALEYTFERAKARRDEKRRKTVKRAVFAPLGSILAVFAAFVLLVNVSPGFAYAAGRIPLLKELALAVAASPSLLAAVENEYVQPIELEQTENGISARIEYAIVDQKQVNFFYTLDGDGAEDLRAEPEMDEECAASYGSFGGEDNIKKMTLDFMDTDVPSELSFTLKVYRFSMRDAYVGSNEDSDYLVQEEYREPEYIAKLHFTVLLDPYYTSQGEHISLSEAAEIDGQRLLLTDAEIYPTHMRFVFDADQENTAWLKALEFYVENEKGERFDGISNGISASGDMETPMMKTFMLESAFFAESKELTMYITGAKWLDKSSERVFVDLENKTAEKLPEGVRFEQAEKKKNGWVLTFSAPVEEENHSYGIFGWYYYGPDGTEYELDGMSSNHGGYFNNDAGRYVEMTDRFTSGFELFDYTDSEVYLCPEYTKIVTLDTPAVLKIK